MYYPSGLPSEMSSNLQQIFKYHKLESSKIIKIIIMCNFGTTYLNIIGLNFETHFIAKSIINRQSVGTLLLCFSNIPFKLPKISQFF